MTLANSAFRSAASTRVGNTKVSREARAYHRMPTITSPPSGNRGLGRTVPLLINTDELRVDWILLHPIINVGAAATLIRPANPVGPVAKALELAAAGCRRRLGGR